MNQEQLTEEAKDCLSLMKEISDLLIDRQTGVSFLARVGVLNHVIKHMTNPPEYIDIVLESMKTLKEQL